MSRFRLSNLFWLVIVASLVIAWQKDRRRMAERIEELELRLEVLRVSEIPVTH